ncbi:MAG TPA: penicillin-binding transpeptidase domain-containing protein [Candidatus Nitrosotenuis sp.]|nr:penicillin-binding transpeptidase domain-containing protein [Candidatus Nitrosotenuis sp.]
MEVKRRVRNLGLLLLALFLLPVAQLTWYQVLRAPVLNDRPDNPRRAEDVGLRGRILDRRARPLATSHRGRRSYPLGPAAAPLLGYLSPRLGTGGLEHLLDGRLSARAHPRTLSQALELWQRGSRRGDDVVLTLDARLQRTAWELLEGRRGAAVVLDIESGEILAAASNPSFDPASVDRLWSRLRADPGAPLVERATGGLYPPGSSFKILIMAAALAEGAARPDEVFVCRGSVDIDGFELHDDHPGGHGALDLEEALAQSCNVTFGLLGARLGTGRVERWMATLGMLERPPGVPGAAASLPPRTGGAQAGIGQGDMLVTPLAMARLAAVMARGGLDLPPRLVRAWSPGGGTLQTLPGAPARRVLEADTTARVARAMGAVVERGTGGAAEIPQGAAGKTGTATNPEGPPHAWFVGFAPAARPRVALAVILENQGYGGQFAAPLAGRLFEAALSP